MTQLVDRIDEILEEEQADAVEVGDELHVPWQVFTLDGLRLTVHWFTNATNDFIGLRVEQDAGEVRITVVERRTSEKLPGQYRERALTLDRALGDRRVVDGATGRPRERFAADRAAAWAAFDETVARFVLGEARIVDLQHAAHEALADGCTGEALTALAAGGGDPAAVLRERGLVMPTRREAVKQLVDAACAEASDDDPYAESIAMELRWIAKAADPDQRAQLAPLLDLDRRIEAILDDADGDGHAEALFERLLAEARELHARGGLRA